MEEDEDLMKIKSALPTFEDVEKNNFENKLDKLNDIYVCITDKIFQVISEKNHQVYSVLYEHREDPVATALLPKEKICSLFPSKEFRALRTPGDGNCLYNAISLRLTGDLTIVLKLRVAVTLELCLFKNFYANHPYIKSKVNHKNSFQKLFGMAQLNSATENWSAGKETEEQSILRSALLNNMKQKWSSLICMLALSSVIRQRIFAIHPKSNDTYEYLFHGVILPREENSIVPQKILLMWSKSYSPTNNFGPLKCNHFVPIFPFDAQILPKLSTSQPQKKIQKRHNNNAGTASTSPNFRTLKLPTTSESDLPTSQTPQTQPSSSTIQTTGTTKLMVKKTGRQKVKSHSIVSMFKAAKTEYPDKIVTNQQVEDKEEENNMPVNDTPPVSVSDVYDIGLQLNKLQHFNSTEKFNILKKVWKPSENFVFPDATKSIHQWLKDYKWLVYSQVTNSIFCLPCLLFMTNKYQFKNKLYCDEGLSYWRSATSKLKSHHENSDHKKCVESEETFLTNQINSQHAIYVQINRLQAALIEENRKKLKPIIAVVELLGKNNIPLRGHRDDSRFYDPNSKEKSENNPGNFQEVINVIRRFSPEVDEMMRNAPKNCTYRSKTIQNQVIDVLKDFILEKIVNGVKVRRLFSVLADEASDVSNKEQMSLVIRFLNQDKAIQEKFVGFLHCENGTSGAELAKLIEKALHEIGLSLSDVRGQGYDGAGSMAGKVRGTAARISARYPKARYVHCWSHQLNLCVVKVTKVVKVKDMFDVCRVIADFFSYQKRCDFLEKLMEKEGIPLNERQSHIDLCRTRWVERIDGLVRMMKLFWVTHKALQLIGTPGSVDFNGDAFNPNTRAIAAGLAKQMEDFTFAMSLVVAKEILSYTASLTKALQDPKVSAVDSYESVSNVIDTISAVHLNVVAYNKKWIRKAEELHESVAPSNSKHDILTPRAPSVSLYRSNVPSSTREEFFRRNLTIPCLENVLSELRSRFSQENIELARGFYVIPSIMASNPTLWKKKVLAFMEANVDDMHDDPGLYEAELELWGNRWSKSDISPSTLEQTLALTSDVIYPNVFKVLHLLAVLPVTTCSCERSISTLRRIKTYLRNTMGQERFNGLALLNIHRNIEIDSEEIINRLAIKYPKRLKLKNIFDED